MKKTGYLFVYESLSKQIDCQLLTPGTQIASEKDLANDFCVSRMTVRKALARLEEDGKIYRRSGIGTFVKFPTPVEAVEVKRLNIGVEAAPDWGGIQRNFVADVLRETQCACTERNCNLLLLGKEELFAGDTVDAVFFPFLDPEDLPRVSLLAKRKPVLLLNRITDDPALGYVAVDYAAETDRVVGRMLRNGAEKILFVGGSGNPMIYAPYMRELGYRSAHRRLGLPVRDELIISRDDCTHYRNIADRLIAERPDVIVVSCEYYLSRVHTALESALEELNKPVYVFSFDDTRNCSSFPDSSVSCGRMPFAEMCKAAIGYLAGRVNKSIPERPIRQIFPMSIIINNCPFLI